MHLPTFAEIMQVAQSRGADSEAPGLWRRLDGAWPLQETGGVTAFDVSGDGKHGTLTNMDPATDRVVTEKGRALDFDGSNDFVNCDTAATPAAYRFTVSAWVLSARAKTTASQYWYIANRGSIYDAGYGLEYYDHFTPGSERWEVWSRGTSLKIAAFVDETPNSGWKHITGTYDGTNLTCYLNGIAGTPVAGVDPATGSNPWRIGDDDRTEATGLFWLGQISNVLRWNRALIPAEIRRLYADPWAMYRLRPRMVFPGWTAPSFKPAWVRRSSQIIGGGVA